MEQQRLPAEQARQEGERKQAAAKKVRLDQEERERSVRTFGTVIHALTRALKPQSALLIAGIVGAILIVGWLIYRGPSNSSKTPGAAPSSSRTTPRAVSLTLRGHTNLVCGVAYSPDGKRLATASEDQTAKVWNAVSGQELLTLRGHTEAVEGVAYSPDGQRLATASADKTAKVWDAEL